MMPIVVVKVGGSLFDHPALGDGLRRWIIRNRENRLLLLPGGGGMADVIRDYHRTHRISEEACHWMAIRTMQVNAFLINAMVNDACEVSQIREWKFDGPKIGVLNAFDFLRADESHSLALPHNWMVTSDAIAARVAEAVQAKNLVLLKSANLPDGISWTEASERGLVDVMFGKVVARANLSVEWVNFRSDLESLTLPKGKPT